MNTIEFRNPHDLSPHPKNEQIYKGRLSANFEELIASIAEKGIYTPLSITYDNRIISGHRRQRAALSAQLLEVPVIVFPSQDEDDITEALIHSNRGMANRTNEMLALEAKELWAIEQKRAEDRRRLAGGDKKSEGYQKTVKEHVPYAIPVSTGQTRDKVGEAIGVSGKTAERAVRVLTAIENLEENGKKREADQLRGELNKSIRTAYDKAQEQGYITKHEPTYTPPKSEQRMADHILLADWKALSWDECYRLINEGRESKRTKFNWQESNNIEWALWSWNPVTGCKHDCPYCYARDIAERFYEQKFEPAFLPERLAAPFNTPMKPEAQTDIGYKNVFTCSMADLFGRWVPEEWIYAVLDTVAAAPQWNFLFLTKFPIRLAEFDFPDNAWVGTTVDCQARVKNAEDAFSRVNAKVKWLSCEPLLEPLHFSDLGMFQWLVLGGSSKSTQTPEWRPPRKWVHDLEEMAWASGCKVYEKTNLLPLERIREYPWEPDSEQSRLPDALRYLPSIE